MIPALLLQVGTGQRMLDLAPTSLVTGGGARVGVDLGAVVPFAGGTVLLTDLGVDGDGSESALGGNSWSATAGVRIDLAGEDGAAQAFVSGGASIGRMTGAIEYPEWDESYRLTIGAGPGAFAGAGADAFVAERVAVGLEVGGAYTSGSLKAEYLDGGSVEDATTYDRIGAFYTWADLHLVFRFGRSS